METPNGACGYQLRPIKGVAGRSTTVVAPGRTALLSCCVVDERDGGGGF